MLVRENSYGFRKRFEFAAAALDGATSVLDLGCGTGNDLTAPLAERFPRVAFTGADSDPASLEFARREHRLPNLRFEHLDEIGSKAFDLVIASEVLEHVEEPSQFLAELHDRLEPNGRLVLTTPNGYGPFELADLVETTLHRSGTWEAVRRGKRALVGGGSAPTEERLNTLAESSPHVNFFSRRALEQVIKDGGFEVTDFRPRTLFCGFVLDYLDRSERLVRWNAAGADRFPRLSSGWMFVLRPTERPHPRSYPRNRYERSRRRWNLERCADRSVETVR